MTNAVLQPQQSILPAAKEDMATKRTQGNSAPSNKWNHRSFDHPNSCCWRGAGQGRERVWRQAAVNYHLSRGGGRPGLKSLRLKAFVLRMRETSMSKP